MTKLHLGCGPVIKGGWYNYDLHPGYGGISLNLTGKLPHEDSSCDEVFSEHFLEHITRSEALGLLRECHRVLRPGGVVRITTPDLKLLATDYIRGKIDRWVGAWAPKTPCQFMNEGMTSWGHKFTYDVEELILILKEAGFEDPIPALHGRYEARGWSGEITVEAVR